MFKREINPIQGQRIILRLLRDGDLPLTLRWRNKDRIRSCFVVSRRLVEGEHAAWYRDYMARDDRFSFIILDKSSFNRPVGQVGIYNIDWKGKFAEFGWLMIGEDDALGKGFAKEAMELLLRYSLEEFKLEQVNLKVMKQNTPAINLYVRQGFDTVAEDTDLLFMVLKSEK